MINEQLINPKSIVIVGGSNDISKPGGKILKNIIDGGYKGDLYVNNPKEELVQDIKSYMNISDLPQTDLAIIAIAAKYTLDTVKLLAHKKGTKAFIIISAGFSEESDAGRALEEKIVSVINEVDGVLIGPNCTGILTPSHHSIFTWPIPKLDPTGCDFASGSGATACFIMESGIQHGLTFANVFSVGNSAQVGVEEVVKYWDEAYDPERSAPVKLLYIENINKPAMLLKHASSLIRKGCRIAAIKSGSSEAGSRAASSHTGALASSDIAVDALFRKAGIVRCYGREDLITVASVFMYPALKGKNIAVITHAGGPAVMLTDALSNNGLNVPPIEGSAAEDLLSKLYPGSSVANPIDFLATGTAEQLGIIIDYVDNKFDHIDAMVVIFGTPGLNPIFDVYDLLDEKMRTAQKPVYPVLPSLLTAAKEIESFIATGRVNFPDEVTLGKALARVYHTPNPAPEHIVQQDVDVGRIRGIIDFAKPGYLKPNEVAALLDAVGIQRAKESVVSEEQKALATAHDFGFPVVMKVVGPVHKSDVGGVVLNVNDDATVKKEFKRLMQIEGATGVMLQQMLHGTELFAGATYEEPFGHMVMCGLGGIFIEVLKDVQAGLVPLEKNEIRTMVRKLKGYKIIEGVRGQEGVNEGAFEETIFRLSTLLYHAPEIVELDLNPLLGTISYVKAVDARIRVEK